MGGGANSSKEPPKTEKQLLREQTRMIDRSAKKLEREIAKLQKQEEKQK